MSSSSSLHPTLFMVQAKNFPARSHLQVAFWHYAFDSTLFMKTCRDWMCMCVRDDGVSYLNNQKACLVSYSMQRLFIRSLETTSTCHEESNIGILLIPIFCWHYHFHYWNQFGCHSRTSRSVIRDKKNYLFFFYVLCCSHKMIICSRCWGSNYLKYCYFSSGLIIFIYTSFSLL